MLRKVLISLFVVVALVAAASLWREYRAYQLRRQERLVQTQHKVEEVQVTIIEGWSMKDIAQALDNKDLVKASDFVKAADKFDLTNYPLIKAVKPEKMSLEGFLFPDTYRFNKQTEPEAVIEKMLTDFTNRVKKLGVSADQTDYKVSGYESLSMNFYKVLTLASIIEKESGGKGPMSLEDERALIAGVFYNRLVSGQALQSDPTVNYATGKSSLTTTDADRAYNSPYNTYLYPGLPPGPICNPSISSINAALHPQKTDYYYFFHKASGQVVFSKTFAEHQRQLQQQ